MCHIEKRVIWGFHFQYIIDHTMKLTFVTLLRPFNRMLLTYSFAGKKNPLKNNRNQDFTFSY